MPDTSSRDQYQSVHIQGVSSVDDNTATNIHVDPVTNRTLTDTTLSGTSLSEEKKYGFMHKIDASATVMYLFKQDSSANWLVCKFDSEASQYKSYATVANNPTVTTYADALTDYLTLTYGTYAEAF